MNNRGFTLIELVMTIAVIGVLSAVAIPRMIGATPFEQQGFLDQTASVLRYAQKSSVSQGRRVCVTFHSDSITLRLASARGMPTCDMFLQGPDGKTPYSVVSKTGISYAEKPSDFSFTSDGRATVTQNINVIGVTKTIHIDSDTGLVYVQ